MKTSIPTGVYRGCSIVVLLDRLEPGDKALFGKLGLDFGSVIKRLDVDQRWLKFPGSGKLAQLFAGLYSAYAAANREIVCLRALEVLVRVAQYDGHGLSQAEGNEFFPAAQVKAVKEVHTYILRHCVKKFSMEAVVKQFGLSYSSFNKIFKTIYGATPYQYVKKLRINQAATYCGRPI